MENSLPKGWVETTVGDCFNEIINGTTITQNKEAKGIPVSRIETIQNNEFSVRRIQHIDETIIKEEQISKYKYQIGDIAFSHINSMEHVGKIAIYSGTPKLFIHGMNLLRLRLGHGHISPKFLYYQMLSKSFREEVRKRVGQAVNQVSINQKNLSDVPLYVAPLAEQHRIVAKLDELLAKVNNSKIRLERIAAIENRLFLGYIFNEDELYKGVCLSKFCEEGVERIGPNWKTKKLIGVSKDEGIVDLRAGGKSTFENYKIVKPGDFIYNPMRVDIGSIAIWNGRDEAITSPDYVVFRTNKTISPQLLLRFLKSPYGLAEVNNNTQGSVRSRLYYRNLIRINFPYSSAEKQMEAEQIFSLFTNHKKKFEFVNAYIQKMECSILAKAFRGELVEQNEQDEPASVLLETLRQARGDKKQTSNKPKPASKRKKVYVENDDLSMAAEE